MREATPAEWQGLPACQSKLNSLHPQGWQHDAKQAGQGGICRLIYRSGSRATLRRASFHEACPCRWPPAFDWLVACKGCKLATGAGFALLMRTEKAFPVLASGLLSSCPPVLSSLLELLLCSVLGVLLPFSGSALLLPLFSAASLALSDSCDDIIAAMSTVAEAGMLAWPPAVVAAWKLLLATRMLAAGC